MHTHYLGDDEVRAYLRDLAGRLLRMAEDRPTVWIPIGPSGIQLAEDLIAVEPALDATANLVVADFDRDTNKVLLEDHAAAAAAIAGQNVLVLDSSVHSGSTMFRVFQRVVELGAKAICSYTLVLKQSSSFIPSIWGVTIGDHDRAYFSLASLPNNHFHDAPLPYGQVRERPKRQSPTATAGGKKKKNAFFHIRRLMRSDIGRPQVTSGTESLDRAKWDDRYYEMKSHPNRTTYLLEATERIAGYLTVERNGVILSVEAIAVGQESQGLGYGAALLRWGETIARQSDCRHIRLWAIDKEMGFYENFGYKQLPNEPLELGAEVYFLMDKPVLSHLP